MRMRLLGLVSLAIVAVLLQTAASQEKKARRIVERSVIVPEDDTPFQMQEQDTVRLTGKGITGAQVRIKIDGPARLVTTSHISRRRNGHPVIGVSTTEFEIKPTAKGKVKATITSTPPTLSCPYGASGTKRSSSQPKCWATRFPSSSASRSSPRSSRNAAFRAC